MEVLDTPLIQCDPKSIEAARRLQVELDTKRQQEDQDRKLAEQLDAQDRKEQADRMAATYESDMALARSLSQGALFGSETTC